MSASEKLKALDAEMGENWKRLSPGAPLIEGPFRNVDALCSVRNALPQIVALTERVEVYIRVDKDRQRRVDTSDMVAALSALEEALG